MIPNKLIIRGIVLAFSLLFLWWVFSSIAFGIAERNYSRGEKRVLEFAKRKEVYADSLEAAADSLRAQRDSALAATTVRVEYIKTYIKTLPQPDSACNASCAEAIAKRDTVIAVQDSLITTQQDLLKASQEIEAKLRGALASQTMRGDSLAAWMARPKPKPSRWSIGFTCGEGIHVATPSIGPGCVFGLSYKLIGF